MSDLKQELIRSLVGDRYDASKLAEAKREFPGSLDRLRNVIFAKPSPRGDAYDVYRECSDVIDCLAYYVSLGAQATERMPGIRYHLTVCDRCPSRLGALEANTLSERNARLVLANQGWKRFTESSGESIKLSEKDIESGCQIGTWSLQPSRPPAFSFSSESHTIYPLTLSIRLPDSTAHINLNVTSVYQASEHRLIWQLILEMVSPSQTLPVYVALGDAIHQTTGYRALKVDRSVEFQILPPVNTYYCLYFEWKSITGQWQTKVERLPLLYEGES